MPTPAQNLSLSASQRLSPSQYFTPSEQQLKSSTNSTWCILCVVVSVCAIAVVVLITRPRSSDVEVWGEQAPQGPEQPSPQPTSSPAVKNSFGPIRAPPATEKDRKDVRASQEPDLHNYMPQGFSGVPSASSGNTALDAGFANINGNRNLEDEEKINQSFASASVKGSAAKKAGNMGAIDLVDRAGTNDNARSGLPDRAQRLDAVFAQTGTRKQINSEMTQDPNPFHSTDAHHTKKKEYVASSW